MIGLVEGSIRCECGGQIGLDKVELLEAYTKEGKELSFVLRQATCMSCDRWHGNVLCPVKDAVEVMTASKFPAVGAKLV